MILKSYDCVCIGAGGAGIAAAVTASRHNLKVAIISKEIVGGGATKISMGVVAYPYIHEEDSPGSFLNDILKGGEMLNNRQLAQTLADESKEAASFLEECGHIFHRDEEGKINAIKVGGHSYPRGISSPPGNGAALTASLKRKLLTSNISIYENCIVVDIVTINSKVRGIIAYNIITGELIAIKTKAVILATGGCGWIYYPNTDCLKSSTGDGFALALKAGAKLVDMEQIQFIPFGVSYPLIYRGLFLGEPSLAGPRGRLLDGKGNVILSKKINKMTRSELVKIMALEIKKGNCTKNKGLYLDLSPNLEAEKGKAARNKLQQSGRMDIVKDIYGEKAYNWLEPWEVIPSCHYIMGGVVIDNWCRTDIEGLYATGEVQGGVHGGNRLGNASLTEIFIFGKRAAVAAVEDTKKFNLEKSDNILQEKILQAKKLFGLKGEYSPLHLKRKLQSIMNNYVGPVRNHRELKNAFLKIKSLEEDLKNVNIPDYTVYNSEFVDYIELGNMILTAKAIVLSAIERRESRGAHIRSDYPDKDKYLYNTITQLKRENMEVGVTTREVSS